MTEQSDRTLKSRLRARAQSMAYSKLAARHPSDYRFFYRRALEKLHAETGLPAPRFNETQDNDDDDDKD